jgi:hypothetical protein
MTEHQPPPEEPLSDQARARIRADLLGAAQDRPQGSRRWLVPLAAAASVVLVAGVTAFAVGRGGDGPETGGPAGQATAPTSSAPPDVVPSDDGSQTPPPDTQTSNSPPGVVEAGAGPCPVELENTLKGADLAATYPDDPSTTYWVKGTRFSLCDTREGTTTVHQPLPLEPDLDDVATWRVSSLFVPSGGGFDAIRVAGGVIPDGLVAFDVAYTFPDGHTEHGTTFRDDAGRTWWRMVYRYDDGGGNEMSKPPIDVTYSLSGVQKTFTLEWGMDTCAQANHGC